MELKTKLKSEEGKQDLHISREFDLPVELLFRAFAEAELIEQWMSNPHSTMKVLKLDFRTHGSYQYETSDAQGNKYGFQGAIHTVEDGKRIVRTFEMSGTPFGIQLEIYDFLKISDDQSRLEMHVVYESPGLRDEVLKLPFAQGINMAHYRIQEILGKLK